MPPLTNHMHEELASLTPILLVLFQLMPQINTIWPYKATYMYMNKNPKYKTLND